MARDKAAEGDRVALLKPDRLAGGRDGLTVEAGQRTGVDAADPSLVDRDLSVLDVRILLMRAAMVHDLGAIGITTSLWDRSRPLSAADV